MKLFIVCSVLVKYDLRLPCMFVAFLSCVVIFLLVFEEHYSYTSYLTNFIGFELWVLQMGL